MLRLMQPPGGWQPSGAVVRADEYQSLLDAEALLADARAEAERIRAEAKAEYAAQKKQGYEDGLRQAQAEGAERGFAAAAETIRYFNTVEQRIVDLVVKALKKVVGELDARERIVGVVRTGLAQLARDARVTVRVSPEEAGWVRADVARAAGSESADAFIEVAPDPRLPAGGCVLETELGIVDASLDVQLEAIRRALAKAVHWSAEADAPADSVGGQS